jgi:chorismate-pyruvate lyase
VAVPICFGATRHHEPATPSFGSCRPVNSDPTRQSAAADLFTRSASRLATLFYDSLDVLGRFEPVLVDRLPDDYRTLLAHHDHMTVALEAYHNSLVNVRALEEWSEEASYARSSLLSRQSDGAVVQFGIMRIWLADLPRIAQEEITSKRAPLGRVLIRHNVLREVELVTLWRIEPEAELRRHLDLPDREPIFGRTAQILVDERPTVQLLEIARLDVGH